MTQSGLGYLSLLTFGSSARQAVRLTELVSFQPPALQASGTAAMVEVMSLLADSIECEVARTTADTKGDWKLLVFIMTDGAPTDHWHPGLARLKKARVGILIACAAGQGAETAILKNADGELKEPG